LPESSRESTTTAPRVSDQLRESIERELENDGRPDHGDGALMHTLSPSSNWPAADAQ
jgi:hypothetical protein